MRAGYRTGYTDWTPLWLLIHRRGAEPSGSQHPPGQHKRHGPPPAANTWSIIHVAAAQILPGTSWNSPPPLPRRSTHCRKSLVYNTRQRGAGPIWSSAPGPLRKLKRHGPATAGNFALPLRPGINHAVLVNGTHILEDPPVRDHHALVGRTRTAQAPLHVRTRHSPASPTWCRSRSPP